ncbi:MAG TPA: diguanylate cyclase [Nitrospiria bacterium]|nr:diguanylate cyclase [Nitrospiria bacterium]
MPLHPSPPSESVLAPIVLLLGPSPNRSTLTRALEHEGYRVEHATPGSDAAGRAAETGAALIILDGDGAARCADLRRDPRSHLVPILVLVGHTDWDERAAAIEAGADAVFSYVPDHTRLLHTVDELIGAACPNEPPVALVFGDTRDSLNHLIDALQRAGVHVLTCQNPADVFTVLGAKIPDAVIIGSRCGGLSGLDAYEALKRQDGLHHAPALFVTDEESHAERLVALRLGFDDYLHRADRHEIVRRVLSRVSRGRFFKHIANRDPLTGVLNYRAFIDRLTHELERASRYDAPLTLILLDVDRFKQLNDRFGHLAGNRALQELVFFLRQRVRKSDLIARLGGDEFAVLMIEAPKDAVASKWEHLSQGFRTTPLPLAGDESPAYVGFSFGMASWPQDGDGIETLIARADTDLYRFKARARVATPDAA